MFRVQKKAVVKYLFFCYCHYCEDDKKVYLQDGARRFYPIGQLLKESSDGSRIVQLILVLYMI